VKDESEQENLKWKATKKISQIKQNSAELYGVTVEFRCDFRFFIIIIYNDLGQDETDPAL